MTTNKITTAVSVTLACAGFLLLSSVAAAQSNNVKGVINGRSGATSGSCRTRVLPGPKATIREATAK
jgi:hypothetical protein